MEGEVQVRTKPSGGWSSSYIKVGGQGPTALQLCFYKNRTAADKRKPIDAQPLVGCQSEPVSPAVLAATKLPKGVYKGHVFTLVTVAAQGTGAVRGNWLQICFKTELDYVNFSAAVEAVQGSKPPPEYEGRVWLTGANAGGLLGKKKETGPHLAQLVQSISTVEGLAEPITSTAVVYYSPEATGAWPGEHACQHTCEM